MDHDADRSAEDVGTPSTTRERRILGVDRGVFEVPDDFDEPLPAEIDPFAS